MAYVVAEPCIKCRHTECVSVCPVDCFYEGANMVAIHPDECIDCGACVPMCPVFAIYPKDALPVKWAEYEELNARLSQVWPNLTVVKGPLPSAAQFKAVEHKRELLDQRPGEGDPPEDPQTPDDERCG
jgi:ferredoxin